MRPGAARSTSSWLQKRWCLEIQNTYTAVPGYSYTRSRYQAYSSYTRFSYQPYSSFLRKAGTRRRVRLRPRPLPSVGHDVGPPCSTFKAARWSQRSATARVGALPWKSSNLGRDPKVVNANASRLFGGVKFHELRQYASAFRDFFKQIWKKALRYYRP